MNSKTNLKDSVIIITGSLIILLVIKYAQEITIPFFLSLFIAIIVSVPVNWLRRKGFSSPIAILCVFILLTIIEIILATLVGASVTKFSQELPVYQQKLQTLVQSSTVWLSGHGIEIGDLFFKEGFDPKWILRFANTFLAGLGDMVSNALLILFTVLFMLFDAPNLPAKTAELEKYGKTKLTYQLVKVVESTQHYISIKTMTSLATGAIITISLSILKLDYAYLWGTTAFLLNYIPNIGSALAAIPAVLMALLQFGPNAALLTIGIYLLTNTIIGSILEPAIMGKSVGLSTLTVFLSLIFWGWLLGPVGMLLSVPLTMLLKFTAESNDETKWISILISPPANRSK